MNDTTINDLKIDGAGSAGGGQYHIVRINGSGQITGDLVCDDFTGNGAVTVQGMLTTQTLVARGAGHFHGGVKAEQAQLHGSSTVQGDTAIRDLQVHGAADLRGDVTGDKVEVQGAVTITGNCNAETFTLQGAFTIGGLLNADTVDLEMHGDCRAREIGGSTIRVTRTRHLLSGLGKLLHSLIHHPHRLVVDTVEGDDVALESTHARVVRGKRVAIGPECEVELLEYTDTCQIDPGAVVKETKKA